MMGARTFLMVIGGIACAASLALTAGPAAAAADSLPMTVTHYTKLCEESGGTIRSFVSNGVGSLQCLWPDQGRTECEVGADQVNVCGIACQSNACLKANPARFSPIWPLDGGPAGGSAAN
ncbi:MAG: hypothetical protein R3D05_05965 [Dongiaceae bacterium]